MPPAAIPSRHAATMLTTDTVAHTPASADLQRLRAQIGRVMVGASEAIELLLVALIAGGHALLDDVPGTGKTTLARALARSLGCSFARLQFTPDLLPTDITGTSVFNQQTSQFERRPGPVFTQVLLADEINRAGPRTQSALLEAMEERQVSLDGATLPLPSPFLVVATQNPVELEGTFPLPEAQLDRFLVAFRLGYPSEADERAMVRRFRADQPLATLEPVIAPADIVAWQEEARGVRIAEDVESYALAITRGTRQLEALQLGVSPRGSLALLRAAQALAFLSGREYVLPDDVKRLAGPVLAHRVVPRTQARLRGQTSAQLVGDLVASVPAPVDRV